MTVRDPHRYSHELDESTTERLIDRLERRGRDEVFTRLQRRYADRLQLAPDASVLELGCGTGVVARAFAARPGFAGRVVGVDQSPDFIEFARRFAADEGVSARTEFLVGDAHDTGLDGGCFDAVIAHTLVSHVTDPVAMVEEAARLVGAGGRVVIFDGDYASLTYACPDDPGFGRRMDHALAAATFNNPLVMRELPALMPELGLYLVERFADCVAEIGDASYFRSFAETYAPLVAEADLLPAQQVERWLGAQRAAMTQGTFFASCNYHTYVASPVRGGAGRMPV